MQQLQQRMMDAYEVSSRTSREATALLQAEAAAAPQTRAELCSARLKRSQARRRESRTPASRERNHWSVVCQ